MRIILVGKAGSGKDYFRDWLNAVEPLDVSYTTRPPRDGEVDGYTYHYITKDEFLTMEHNDAFLEAVEFNGWKYGTSRFNWENKTVFIMTPSGTKCIPKEDRAQCVFVYFDIPIDVRRKRLAKRSDADSVERRLEADEKDFADFKDFNIRVTNPFFDPERLYTTINSFYYV
jgi:guanylate kinase